MKHEVFHRAMVNVASRLPKGRLRAYRLASQWTNLVTGTLPCSTNWGGVLECDPHDFIDQRILAFGVWEPQLTQVISARLGAGDLFVDIGANIGYYSVLAGLKVGAAGKVVAIEASPSIFRRLEANVALNTLAADMDLVNVAVSDAPAELEFYKSTDTNTGRSSIVPHAGLALEARVKALPLHDILSAEDCLKVRLVKIDIEGSEPPVIASILDNLARYNPAMELVVEASATPEWEPLFQRFLAAGFRAFGIPNGYAIDDYMRHRGEPAVLTELFAIPAEQTDILWTRSGL